MRARESRRRNGSILVSIENTEKHGKVFSGFQNTTVGLKSRERPIATRREARTFFYLASFVVAPEALLAFFRAP
jgi:hypothetical protein